MSQNPLILINYALPNLTLIYTQVPNHVLVYIYVYYIQSSITMNFGILNLLVVMAVALINVHYYFMQS